MRYYIGFLPDDDFQEFYRSLVKDICDEFDLPDLREKKRIAHVTLKSPFERVSEYDLVREVDEIAAGEKASNLLVRRANKFSSEILYLAVEQTGRLSEVTRTLLHRLGLLGDVPFDRTWDKDSKVFHLTIAKNEEVDGKFDEIFRYLQKATLPEKRLKFDNLAIFQKDNGRTSVISRHYFL